MKKTGSHKFDVTATVICICMLLLWIGAIYVKYLTDYLDVWTQNALRYLVAALFWLPSLMLSLKKNEVEKRIWKRAIAPAIANVIMQTCFAAAIYYINPAFAVLLTKSSIIWIAGFSLIFFAQERSLLKSKRFWLGMALSVAGVIGVMIFKEDFTTQDTMTGIIFALVAAFLWAVYTIVAKIAFKGISSRCGFSVMSIYSSVGFCILAITLGKPQQCLTLPPKIWGLIVISSISSIALTHVLYYSAMNRIGATIPSLVMLLQPFIVFIFSNIIFGETLNGLQWVFGIVLLVGSAFAIWSQKRLTPETLPAE